MPFFGPRPEPGRAAGGTHEPPVLPRVLFLDDDPRRAEVFLAEHPQADWVQTAAGCITRLEEPWDEVHLDHDLGGEHYVDPEREDCGMEVVRWLCREPRPNLEATRFTVHSHNDNAAVLMAVTLAFGGYAVTQRPFGEPPPPATVPPPAPRVTLAALGQWVARRLGRGRPGGPGGAAVPSETACVPIGFFPMPPSRATPRLEPDGMPPATVPRGRASEAPGET